MAAHARPTRERVSRTMTKTVNTMATNVSS